MVKDPDGLFTTEELHLLLSLCGPCISFGIRNPHLGRLANEREEVTKAAQDALAHRGIIQMQAEQIVLPELLARMIITMARPDHTAILTTQELGRNRQVSYVHFGSDLIVEHSPQRSEEHRLAAYESHEEILWRIRQLFQVSGQRAAKGGQFILPEKALSQTRKFLARANSRQARKCLIDAGLKETQADELALALCSPASNSSVVVIVNRNHSEIRYVKGMGILAGTPGMWALDFASLEDKEIQFTPRTADEVTQSIDELLPE